MQRIERLSFASYRNNWERQLSSRGGQKELPREDRQVLCIPCFIQQTAVNFHCPRLCPLWSRWGDGQANRHVSPKAGWVVRESAPVDVV